MTWLARARYSPRRAGNGELASWFNIDRRVLDLLNHALDSTV